MDAHTEHQREERIRFEHEHRRDGPPEDAVRRAVPSRIDDTAEAGIGEEVHVDHGDAEQRKGAHQVGQRMSDMVQGVNYRKEMGGLQSTGKSKLKTEL